MAKWAIGLRGPGLRDGAVEAAVNAGTILRTHILRPTWHFVAAADLRWMLVLTAPRVRAQMAYMNRQLELSAREFKRSKIVFAKALVGNQQLTRVELQTALSRARIAAQGPRLAHLLMDAELDGLICSGARRGKHSTYALIEERVPATPPLNRESALAELTRRYFNSRGPATAADFAWWSGLTVTDAKAGVSSLANELAQERIGGSDYFLAPGAVPRDALKHAHFLLPDYDEYGIAYKDRRAFFSTEIVRTPNLRNTDAIAFNRMLVLNGLMVGSWGRKEVADSVRIEVVPFAPFDRKQQRALEEAAAGYAAFVGKEVVVTVRRAHP